MDQFKLTAADLKRDLDLLAQIDGDMKAAIDFAGYPEERRREADFGIFLNIIVGQQLSVKAAATINARLSAALDDNITPKSFLQLDDAQLRAVGLSRPKMKYARQLCEKTLDGRFQPDALAGMDDQGVIDAITALLGFGRWSAEMYLLFSLGRPDVWPADDLAVQEAVRRLKKLDQRPSQKEMDVIAQPWRPYRGAAAIFLWHYYKKTPDLA